MVAVRNIKMYPDVVGTNIKFLFRIFSFLLFFSFNVYCFSQGLNVTARVDSNNVLIGDWIKLYIEAEYPNNVQLNWPPISDSLGKLEIVDRTSPHVERTERTIKEKVTLTLAAFDTGTHVIPALNFTFKNIQQLNQSVDTTSIILGPVMSQLTVALGFQNGGLTYDPTVPPQPDQRQQAWHRPQNKQ